MIIRKARLKDVPVISKMEYDLNSMHSKFDSLYNMKENSLSFLRKLQFIRKLSPNKLLLVAEIDGEIVGFISAIITNRPPIFMENKIGGIDAAYIKKEFQRRGIGKELTDETFSWLKNKGVKYIEISVHEKNLQGIGAWNKYGFKPFAQKMIKHL
jgi:ribosomal protein S18 acetylase RimI-like enzyme